MAALKVEIQVETHNVKKRINRRHRQNLTRKIAKNLKPTLKRIKKHRMKTHEAAVIKIRL